MPRRTRRPRLASPRAQQLGIVLRRGVRHQRAQAHQLLDIARFLAAIHGAVAAGTETSHTRDSDPAAVAVLDYGLTQHALIAVSARSGDVAEPDPRLATR
ncbi:hypothetical protein AB0C61_20355 [Streptomyces sp. NPDC048680]|uniref:hypothetical protein n=1 Tax=Streptomyces sp. NPDC048680 TaxID=3155492 RepID=UPI00343F73E2